MLQIGVPPLDIIRSEVAAKKEAIKKVPRNTMKEYLPALLCFSLLFVVNVFLSIKSIIARKIVLICGLP